MERAVFLLEWEEMRTLFSAAFGLYLLLGNIALVGVSAMAPAGIPTFPELEEALMTLATSEEVTMSVVTYIPQETEATPLSCGDERSLVHAPGTNGACPTDRCVRASDDQTHPEEMLLVVRPTSENNAVAMTSGMHSLFAPTESFGTFTRQEQPYATLAFHLSNVVLRE